MSKNSWTVAWLHLHMFIVKCIHIDGRFFCRICCAPWNFQ